MKRDKPRQAGATAGGNHRRDGSLPKGMGRPAAGMAELQAEVRPKCAFQHKNQSAQLANTFCMQASKYQGFQLLCFCYLSHLAADGHLGPTEIGVRHSLAIFLFGNQAIGSVPC